MPNNGSSDLADWFSPPRPTQAGSGMANPVPAFVPDMADQYAQKALAVSRDYFEAGNFEAALGACMAGVAIAPHDVGLHNAAGVILCKLGRYQKAVRAYGLALKGAPGEANILGNLGNAYQELQLYDRAEQAHRQAAALSPQNAQSWRSLGDSLARRGKHGLALEAYGRALALREDDQAANWGMATTLLRLGELERGWKFYEHRWWLNPKNPPRQFEQPRWNGGPFPGRTLYLYWEQGFGDCIHCLRYLPQVKALGGKVVLEIQEELERLCRPLPWVDQVVRRTKGAPPPLDLHYPLLSTPLLFSPRLADIPRNYPYLSPTPESVAAMAPLFTDSGDRLRVGIVWSGSPDFEGNHHRATTLEPFLRHFLRDGVRLYSLQKGAAAQELAASPQARMVTDLAPHLGDFADTAGAIAHLDLVIMTDTAVAHLCGAMDKPVWVMLPYFAHWVWGPPGKSECPWYASATLFRQTAPGDWSQPFALASRRLAELAAARRRARQA